MPEKLKKKKRIAFQKKILEKKCFMRSNSMWVCFFKSLFIPSFLIHWTFFFRMLLPFFTLFFIDCASLNSGFKDYAIYHNREDMVIYEVLPKNSPVQGESSPVVGPPLEWESILQSLYKENRF